MTRGDLLERMSSAEYVAWAGFYTYEQKEREAAEKKPKKRKSMGKPEGFDGVDG